MASLVMPDPKFSGKRILVVDDEAAEVRFMQVRLEQVGYKVITASNGKDALKKIETETPHLVVMDVMMPDMDSYDVLVEVRQRPETQALPVILMSKKAQEGDVFRGGGGVDAYLTKPIDFRLLLNFVARLL